MKMTMTFIQHSRPNPRSAHNAAA